VDGRLVSAIPGRSLTDAGSDQPSALTMADKKAFLLRIDPVVWVKLERLAQSELRSVNAQIEFLLRDALARRGHTPRGAGTVPTAAKSKNS
jgi:hypothetical protein